MTKPIAINPVRNNNSKKTDKPSNVINRNIIKFSLSTIFVFLICYILRINLAISLFLLSILLYIKFSYKNLNLKPYVFLHLTLLFVIIFVTSYFVLRQGWSEFWIPFSVIPMLSAILFNQLQLSLLLTVASSVTVASLAHNNLYLGILFFISATLSSIFVYGARRRITIIRAGFIVGFVQVISLFFIERFSIQPLRNYIMLMFNGIISGVIVLGILPVFEYLFKTITNISLLELADCNHPLLQRLMLEAPGTYHHSLIVGNLSESACAPVGANALLARIGAYYHDIGKLKNPEYFSENQNQETSVIHDTLAATLSKMVIINHVKEGVELAKKYKLNPLVRDFILQHHGNSLVYYFYRRALESLEEDQEIKEEGFRYPGPKPETKEIAIVLLADSVEASTRALKESLPAKIEEVVHKIINNKFIDGQLDECNLTLKDLEKISSVFVRILNGIYHSRITYPKEVLKSENNHKKPSEEGSHLSEKDKKSNS